MTALYDNPASLYDDPTTLYDNPAVAIATPVFSLVVDWDDDGFTVGALDDVSVYVRANPGTVLVSVDRGANFEGGGGGAGSGTFIVANHDNRFTPQNTVSPLYGKLKPGKQVWATVAYDGVTYPIFHGWLRRIVPMGDGHCQLFAEDALFRFARREVNIATSDARTITAFRGAILDAMGEPSARRSFHDTEYAQPITGADGRDGLNLLSDLCESNRSIHFIRPTITAADPYQYVVKARSYLQSRPVTVDLADTQLTSTDNLEVVDTNLINSQRVTPRPKVRTTVATELWTRERITAGASETVIVWASWSGEAFSGSSTYTVSAGSATVTVTFFQSSAKVTIVAGVSGATVDDLTLYGAVVADLDTQSVLSEDATSITANGRWEGGAIDSEWIPNEPEAVGLAGYVTWRYASHKARPGLSMQDQYPVMWQIEPGDRLRFDNGRLAVTNDEVQVETVSLEMRTGGIWTADFKTEEAPAVVNIFTIGDPTRGIGSGAILGY